MHATDIHQLKIQCVSSYQVMAILTDIFYMNKKLLEDDGEDVEYNAVLERRGNIGSLNSFYFNVLKTSHYFKFGERP
jgi:hypothetical protein